MKIWNYFWKIETPFWKIGKAKSLSTRPFFSFMEKGLHISKELFFVADRVPYSIVIFALF